MTEHITIKEFGTILADFVFLPDDDFEEQAAELIRVLNTLGFEIVKTANREGPVAE